MLLSRDKQIKIIPAQHLCAGPAIGKLCLRVELKDNAVRSESDNNNRCCVDE
jgi:hypothetical protein